MSKKINKCSHPNAIITKKWIHDYRHREDGVEVVCLRCETRWWRGKGDDYWYKEKLEVRS